MQLREITINGGVLHPAADSLRRSRLIIFVHGNNTPPARARQVYRGFREGLRAFGVTFQLESFVELYWPSYIESLVTGERTASEPCARDFVRGMKLLSALTYPVQVIKAQDVGRLLGQYILQLKGPGNAPPEIVFVAHSLGCRVVLEAAQAIAVSQSRGDHPVVLNICLLAGAVPCYMFGTNGRLARSASATQKSCVLFSRHDVVLQGPFRIGQTAAREGFFPVAIGTSGEPTAAWTARIPTELQHSDYIESQNGQVGPHLARFLGIAAPLPIQARSPMALAKANTVELPYMLLREWHIHGNANQ